MNIKDLSGYLLAAYKIDSNKIKLKIDVNTVFFGVDIAIPCGLIINELISNAIKFAFPEDNENGCIEIKLYKQEISENKYILIVKDNGVGFPDDIDFTKSGSLGLELVSTLVEQLDGIIEKLPVNGTEFKIEFNEGIRK